MFASGELLNILSAQNFVHLMRSLVDKANSVAATWTCTNPNGLDLNIFLDSHISISWTSWINHDSSNFNYTRLIHSEAIELLPMQEKFINCAKNRQQRARFAFERATISSQSHSPSNFIVLLSHKERNCMINWESNAKLSSFRQSITSLRSRNRVDWSHDGNPN